MKDNLKLTGFIMIACGFIGIMMSDFIFNLGTGWTLLFAVLNASGLTVLGIAHWKMRY